MRSVINALRIVAFDANSLAGMITVAHRTASRQRPARTRPIRLWLANALPAFLFTSILQAQSDASTIRPLRTTPSEKFTVDNGNRDWGPATVADNVIVAGGPSGRGGLHAVDMSTGKLKWSYRPADINGSVSTPPAIVRDLVIAAFGAANPGAVIAVSLSTGKAVWRGPDPAANATVVASTDLVYVQDKNGNFIALDALTGKEIWRRTFSRRRFCVSRPAALEGVVYVSGSVDATSGDASKTEGFELFALDAKTGQERWRHRAEAQYGTVGVCLRQLVVTGSTIYAADESRLYAVDRATGRDRWKSVETRATVAGVKRLTEVVGLVDAGAVLVGLTESALVVYEQKSGRTAWELPGTFTLSAPSTAVAGNVLYFQGSPESRPAAASRGTLYALDLDTRSILWSFTRVTAEKNWSFGAVTPMQDGLWVDSYKALLKLVP